MRYAAVHQSLGEPDAFRLQYRDYMRSGILEIILQKLNKQQAVDFIKNEKLKTSRLVIGTSSWKPWKRSSWGCMKEIIPDTEFHFMSSKNGIKHGIPSNDTARVTNVFIL